VGRFRVWVGGGMYVEITPAVFDLPLQRRVAPICLFPPVCLSQMNSFLEL